MKFILLFLVSSTAFANMVTPFIQKNSISQKSSLLALPWQQRNVVGINTRFGSLDDVTSQQLGPRVIYSDKDISLEVEYTKKESFNEVSFDTITETNLDKFDANSAIKINKNYHLIIGLSSLDANKTATEYGYYEEETQNYATFNSSTGFLGLSANFNNFYYGVVASKSSIHQNDSEFAAIGYLNDQKNVFGEFGYINIQKTPVYLLTLSGKSDTFQLKNTFKFIEKRVINIFEIISDINDSSYYGVIFNPKELESKLTLGLNFNRYNIESSIGFDYYGLNFNYKI